MYHACITTCITLARFVAVVVCWDITDKWHSFMLSPYFLIKIGLELLNGIIYNGALCLTSNSNRNQLINYVLNHRIDNLGCHFGYSGFLVPWNGKGKLLNCAKITWVASLCLYWGCKKNPKKTNCCLSKLLSFYFIFLFIYFFFLTQLFSSEIFISTEV